MRKNILGPIAVATALSFGSTPTHAQSAPDAIVLNTQAGMQSALQDKSKEIGSVLQIQSKEAAICSLGITVRDPNNVDYCDALERQKIKQEKEDEEKKRLYEQLALLTGTGALGVLAYGRWGAPYISKRKKEKEEQEREELGMNDQLNELSWEKSMATNTAGEPDSNSQHIGIDHALEARLREKAKTARLEREEQERNAPKGQKNAKEDDSFDLSGGTLWIEPENSGTNRDDDFPSFAEREAAIIELLASEEIIVDDNIPGKNLDNKEKIILKRLEEKPDNLELYKDFLRIYYAKNDKIAFAQIYMRDELAQFRTGVVDHNITWIRELGRKMDPENPIYEAQNDYQDTVAPQDFSDTVISGDTPEIDTSINQVATTPDWTKTVAMETSDIKNAQENQLKVHIDRSLRTRLERGGFEIQEDSHTGEVSILVKKIGTNLIVMKLVAAPIGQRHENQETFNCGDIYILGKDIVRAELDPSMNYIKLISSKHTRTLIRING